MEVLGRRLTKQAVDGWSRRMGKTQQHSGGSAGSLQKGSIGACGVDNNIAVGAPVPFPKQGSAGAWGVDSNVMVGGRWRLPIKRL